MYKKFETTKYILIRLKTIKKNFKINYFKLSE